MQKTRYGGKIKFVVRLAGSVLLLGWLISRTGTSSLVSAFQQISSTAWGLAICSYVISQLISSFRWKGIAEALGFSGGYPRFLALYFTGMFFNLFMPTSIGGDVLKTIFLAGEGNEGGKLRAGYSVFIDRLSGMTGLFILGSCTVIIFRDLLPGSFSLSLVAVTAAGILMMCTIKYAGKTLLKYFPSMKERVAVILKVWDHPSVPLRGLILSVFIQFFGITTLAVMGSAMHINVEPAYYFAIFPAVALLSILPVSISGLGIREGTLACFLAMKKVPEDQAVALGLLFFAVQAVVSLAGGLIYIAGLHRR